MASGRMGNLAVSEMCVYSSLMSVNEMLSAFLEDALSEDWRGYLAQPAAAAGAPFTLWIWRQNHYAVVTIRPDSS